MNFGKHHDINHIFQQTDASINAVDIDIANGNVSILPWDQNDIRVECEAQVYKGETQEEARQNFLQEMVFEVRGDRLFFYNWAKVDQTKSKGVIFHKWIMNRLMFGFLMEQLKEKIYRLRNTKLKLLMEKSRWIK